MNTDTYTDTYTDPNAELKKQYAIDAHHHPEPWIFWEYFTLHTWKSCGAKPAWHPVLNYRRKPDAPRWLPDGVSAPPEGFDFFGRGPLPHPPEEPTCDISLCAKTKWSVYEVYGNAKLYYAIRRGTELHRLNFGEKPMDEITEATSQKAAEPTDTVSITFNSLEEAVACIGKKVLGCDVVIDTPSERDKLHKWMEENVRSYIEYQNRAIKQHIDELTQELEELTRERDGLRVKLSLAHDFTKL